MLRCHQLHLAGQLNLLHPYLQLFRSHQLILLHLLFQQNLECQMIQYFQ